MKNILVLLVLLSVGCATPLPQNAPAGMPASVEAPQVRVGDSWTYQFTDGYTQISKGIYRYTVAAIEAQRMRVDVSHDGNPVGGQVFTRDWNWLEKPMTNLQNFRYDPPYPALPFPLAAGKTWRAYIKATDPVAGRTNRVRIDGKVLGWERVKVPAGIFDALKVQRLVYAGNADYDREEEDIFEVDWYAPLLGQVIKHVSSSRYIDKRETCDENGCNRIVKNDWNVFELTSFAHGDDGNPPR
jgi:hypothetical protein